MTISKIKVMGVLNVTPDSFSDGGLFASSDNAVKQAEKLISDGADILDIGGESTRPFADPVGTEEELQRVIPVIETIRSKFDIPISIDTMKAEVARRALMAGANLINDISALRADPEMIQVVKSCDAPIVIMHMQGTPQDMQVNPQYDNIVEDVLTFLNERIDWITSHGVARKRLIIDPGIGFGKKLHHNLSLLKHLEAFSTLDLPVLLAHSRKRFLGEITGVEEELERDFATAVVAALSSLKKINMVRVHNVAATRQALNIAEAVVSAE